MLHRLNMFGHNDDDSLILTKMRLTELFDCELKTSGFTSIYKIADLPDYFKNLTKIIKKNPHNIGVAFASMNWCFGVYYHAEMKTWTIIDPLLLKKNPENYFIDTIADEETNIVDLLCKRMLIVNGATHRSDAFIFNFETLIFNQNENIITEVKQQFLSKIQPSCKHWISEQGISLAHLAAKFGHLEEFVNNNVTIRSQLCLWDTADKKGRTPFSIAIANNDLQIINAIMSYVKEQLPYDIGRPLLQLLMAYQFSPQKEEMPDFSQRILDALDADDLNFLVREIIKRNNLEVYSYLLQSNKIDSLNVFRKLNGINLFQFVDEHSTQEYKQEFLSGLFKIINNKLDEDNVQLSLAQERIVRRYA